jgi:hypothetical protein
MKNCFVFCLLSLFASAAFAAGIRFDPPNPTSRTPVTAYVTASFQGCQAISGTPTRSGSIVSITLKFGCTTPAFNGPEPVPVDLGVLPAGVYDVVAGPETLLIGLAEGFLPVADAEPPFAVQPNVALTTGGTVLISAPNLIACLAGPSPIVCEKPIVRFGDVAVEPTATGPDEILVQAPPHAAGAVDVTVQTQRGTLRATAAFRYVANGEEPDPAFFERVLFPVFLSGPGSFGSLWQTELAVHNGNPFVLTDSTGLFNTFCMPTCDVRVAANTTKIVRGGSSSAGVVDSIARQSMPNLNFSLLARDLSRDATAFGTSIPVVRESEMFDRPFAIPNVPADPRYRLNLRLYAYANGTPILNVKIVPLSGGAVTERTVVLSNAPGNTHAFATMDVPTGTSPVRIEVAGASKLVPAWGFVSVTNNDTQNVTVIAPE